MNVETETLWAAWDFENWLLKQGPDVFPVELKNWTKRGDTVHQLRFCRSWVCGDARDDSGCVYRHTGSGNHLRL